MPALLGKKRSEALRLIAGGASDREVGRTVGVDHKTIGKLRKSAAEVGKTVPKVGTRSATPSSTDELSSERLLEDDLRLRLEIRDGLHHDFSNSDDPRERTFIARELNNCLDGIRKVALAPTPRDDDEADDDEAQVFDTYMLSLLAKGRIVKDAASPGLPDEAESAGEVGDRGRESGTDG